MCLCSFEIVWLLRWFLDYEAFLFYNIISAISTSSSAWGRIPFASSRNWIWICLNVNVLFLHYAFVCHYIKVWFDCVCVCVVFVFVHTLLFDFGLVFGWMMINGGDFLILSYVFFLIFRCCMFMCLFFVQRVLRIDFYDSVIMFAFIGFFFLIHSFRMHVKEK